MSKFIRLKTLAGTDLLLRTELIVSVYEHPETTHTTHTRIELHNAIDHDDAYDVIHTVDEIQAMIEKAEAK